MSVGIPITNANFESEVLQSPIPVLVDFWAPWCASCKMMASLVDQLAGEYAGRIKIGMVNVDEEGTLGEQHEVVSLPTMVLYQNGEILQKKVGALPKREIENLFKDVLY